MASVQSYILKFWIRRLRIFNRQRINSQVLRKRMDRWGDISKPHPGVKVVEVNVSQVSAEWLIPEGAPENQAILYIHGGAWYMGSAKSHRALVSNLAYQSGTRVLSINYRLAPEHPFPEGLDDCITAYEWMLENCIPADKIVLAGDSAGGNLALALLIAQRDRGRPLPAGAVLLSPATDLVTSGKSPSPIGHLDPYFSNMGPNRIIPDYIGGHDPHDPLISPIYGDLRGLPPLLIHVGEHEMLLSDVVNFGERAIAAGVDAKTVVWPKMFHVFQMFSTVLPEARQSNDQIAKFISARLNSI
jgi:monoterpene epsilon-lactone hydrolase